MADNNDNDNSNGNGNPPAVADDESNPPAVADDESSEGADDLSSDDDEMDEDERVAIEAAMRAARQLREVAQQPVLNRQPRPTWVQAKLLGKMKMQIQKKDKDGKK